MAGAELSTETATAEYQFQMLVVIWPGVVFGPALEDAILAISQQDLAWLETITQTMEEISRERSHAMEVLQVQNERAKQASNWRRNAIGSTTTVQL